MASVHITEIQFKLGDLYEHQVGREEALAVIERDTETDGTAAGQSSIHRNGNREDRG